MEGWTVPPVPADLRESSDKDVTFFQDLGLHPRILRAILEDQGFSHTTPIQAKALPPALDGADVAGRAQTGTGKTAAFLITTLQAFLSPDRGSRSANQPFALTLAPTRELAIQIDRDAEALGVHCGVRHLAVYGGVDYAKQKAVIAGGVDIVAATPGRLIDYANQRVVDLSKVAILVIDEADRMLDMGFIPDVKRILARLPVAAKRQTLLFSATLSPAILRLANAWMRSPVMLEVDPEQVVATGVEEIVYAVSSREKLALLLWILANEPSSRVLVFRNRRRDTDDLESHLQRYGIDCAVMSGDVPQNRRTRLLDAFREGQIRVIVATDVAGRGIHVEGISHVINYDLPYEPEDYVHRIGRTGRAGDTGRAVSFACEQRSFVIPEIEQFIDRDLPITHPEPEMLVLPAPPHAAPDTQSRRPSHSHGSRSSRSRSGSGGRRRR